MDIRFVSSLTAEDENAFAPALLKAIGVLLDQLPLAYTLRIETTGAQVLQHSHTAVAPATKESPSFLRSAHVSPYSAAANGSPRVTSAGPPER
jgi:hypothetical protein